MSKSNNELMTRNLPLQLSQAPDSHLIEDAGIEVPVSLGRELVLRIMDSINALVSYDGSSGKLEGVKGVVAWPIEIIEDAMGIELDRSEFDCANIEYSKSQVWFSLPVKTLGVLETVQINVADLVAQFDRVETESAQSGDSAIPSQNMFPVMLTLPQIDEVLQASTYVSWENADFQGAVQALEQAKHTPAQLDKEQAVAWFRGLLHNGTEDIEAEADVAKAIVASFVAASPVETIRAVMDDWYGRVKTNADGVFDFVHAFPPENDEEGTLLQQAELMLGK